MASIFSVGVGSGLDIGAIISQLMAVERAPLERIAQRQSDIKSQVSAYGQVKSAFSSFETKMNALASSSSFLKYAATSSDETIGKVSVSNASIAQAGSYDVTVNSITQASEHQVRSGLFSDVTNVGAGTLDFTLGDSSTFSVIMERGTNSLTDLRDAINNATGNTGAYGITASIVNDGSGGGYLVMTSNSQGAGYSFSSTYTSADSTGNLNGAPNDPVRGDLEDTMEVTGINDPVTVKTGVDASVDYSINGIPLTSTTTSIVDAIPGITLDLSAVGTTTVDVSVDNAGIKNSVKEFVSAFNAIRSTLKNLHAEGATLEGDNTLISLDRRLMSVMNTSAGSGTFKYLTEVGVTFDKNGTLTLDEAKLDDALSTDISAVTSLFADETNGFATRLASAADSITAFNGTLTGRTNGLNNRLDALDTQAERLLYRLERIEARYQNQYTNLDALLGNLNSTSNYLSQQLSALSSLNKK